MYIHGQANNHAWLLSWADGQKRAQSPRAHGPANRTQLRCVAGQVCISTTVLCCVQYIAVGGCVNVQREVCGKWIGDEDLRGDMNERTMQTACTPAQPQLRRAHTQQSVLITTII